MNYNGSAIASSGYVVKRYKGSTLDTVAGNCTGNVTSVTCSDTLTAGGTFSYSVTPKSGSWIGTESAKSGAVTYTPVAPPFAPTSASISNGAGTGALWVNNASTASVNFSVVLPSTSKTTDVIHLTVSDAGNAHAVTAPTAAGSNGAGTVNFLAVDLSSLSDGALTVTAWATNAGGSSGNRVNSTYSKDVVAPSAPVITSPSNNATGVAKKAPFSGTASEAGGSVVVSVTGSGSQTSPSATPGSSSPFNWSTTLANNLPNSGTFSATATHTDAAGNASSASTAISFQD
ncbi:MAG: hypothetical protein JJD92_06215 [Frankiaceae bacterium]|nr:hypothetical protein [Frankiaceae bacterium]